MKRLLKRLGALMMVAVIAVTTTEVGVNAETNQHENVVEAHKLPTWVQMENVGIAIRVVNEWEDGYQAEVTLKNTGVEVIRNWEVDFTTADRITDIWNGNVLQNDGSFCTVASMDYNSEIKPDESVSFGYRAEGNNCTGEVLALRIMTEGNKTAIEESFVFEYDTYRVEFQIKNEWKENCNAIIRIKNITDIVIENWTLSCETDDSISNVYDATMCFENGAYTFKNKGYNQDILPGEIVEFGFDVYYGEKLDVPVEYVMTYSANDVAKEAYAFENVVKDRWDEGYVGELQLTNQSDKVMEDWSITIRCEDKITNLWNGEITAFENGVYNIKNPQYYQNIQPGETVIIGYQAEGEHPDSIKILTLVAGGEMWGENDDTTGDDSRTEDDGTTGDDNTTEGEGATGDEGTLGDDNIAGDDNTTGDNGTTEDDNTNGENDNKEDDKIPEDGEEPYQGKYVEITTEFEKMNSESEEFLVSEELIGLNGKINNLSNVESVTYQVIDVMESIVQEDNVSYNVDNGSWVLENFGLVIGWNEVVFVINLKDGSVAEESFCFINSVYENMEKTNVGLADTDGDGINDYFETVLGTNKDSDDEDKDGITDFDELMLTGTEPSIYDTDSDGICDADEDEDEDGLTVLEELAYGTSPLSADSDMDGLDDKQEIADYGTNPLKEDTDEDGLTDGEEILLGTNPLLADTDNDGIPDCDEKIEQIKNVIIEDSTGVVKNVSVSLSCSGDIENQLFVENTMGVDMLSSEVVGLVGVPVEIHSITTFDEAVITFAYDREKLGEAKEDNLCVMWYDEENMQYVLLEDSVIDKEKQTVSYTTTHFSTYLLVDKEIWIDAWRRDMNYKKADSENVTYDIMIILDYSVSEEELALEKAFAERIIEQMVDGDRIRFGVITQNGLRSYYQTDSEWCTTKKYAKNTLANAQETIYNQYQVEIGPTETYNGDLYDAVHLLTYMQDTDTENEEIAFIIDAGKNEENTPIFRNHTKESTERLLQSIGFPVHSISVSGTSNVEFAAMIEKSGGESYVAANVGDRIDHWITHLNLNVDGYDMLDTDGDGIYDTVEVNGVRIQNGKVMYTDPYKADTNGDGVSDFDELGGLPYFFTMQWDNEEFVSTINYYKELQTSSYTIGLDYMFVDDFDYLPYNKSNYDKIFIDRTSSLDADGNAIFGRKNIYGSNPDELSGVEIAYILSKVLIQHNLLTNCGIYSLDADEYLLNYVINKSDRRYFDYGDYLRGYRTARILWASDVYGLMIAAENSLGKNQTKIITQTPDNENSGITFKPIMFDIKTGTLEFGIDSFFAIHEASTRSVARVTYNGEIYTMELKYYLFDYYDWDESLKRRLPFISDNELYKLCRTGWSKFYEHWGIYETKFSWKATPDEREKALVLEKIKMMSIF